MTSDLGYISCISELLALGFTIVEMSDWVSEARGLEYPKF